MEEKQTLNAHLPEGFALGSLEELSCHLFNVSTSFMVYNRDLKNDIFECGNFSKSEINFIKYAINYIQETDLIIFSGDNRNGNMHWPYASAPFNFCVAFKIKSNDGNLIGTLFLLDKELKELPEKLEQFIELISTEIRQKYATKLKLSSLQNLYNNLIIENKEIKCARSIVEMMHDGLTVQNKNGELLLANPSAYEILGIKDLASSNSNASDEHWCVTDENGKELSWQEHPSMVALHSNKTLNNEIIKVNRPDGKSIWLSVNATPFAEEGENEPSKVFAAFADVSAQKEYENYLKNEKAGAEAANAAKSSFLANMSHEIRTPLNGVIGVVDALLRTSLEANQLEMAKIIESSSKVLLTLLNDILDYSKAEAGKIKLENRPFDLKKSIEEAANLLRIQADEKGIGFDLFFSTGLNDFYEGDIVRFKQIISNLASNAVKFTNKGKVEIEVEQCTNNKGIEIIVRDSGIGMRDDTIAKLFRRFEQADVTTTRKFGGTGLGLAISKSLIDLMNGTIKVSSKLGFGTQFVVYLPFQSVDTYSHLTNIETYQENFIQKGIDILLAEDHPMNQRVFELMVSHISPNLTIVANGQQAIEEFKTKKFDIIFMDMNMPVMDGVSATKAIRDIEIENNYSRTPIIMLTASAGEEYNKIATEAGAEFLLTKPATIQSISETIALFLTDATNKLKNKSENDLFSINDSARILQ